MYDKDVELLKEAYDLIMQEASVVSNDNNMNETTPEERIKAKTIEFSQAVSQGIAELQESIDKLEIEREFNTRAPSLIMYKQKKLSILRSIANIFNQVKEHVENSL